MTTLAVIPARLGATRLPRKPLRLLGNIPLVIRVWQRVLATGVVERVVIATDSRDVAAVAGEHGAECVITAAEHPSGTDRVAEVARRPEFRDVDVLLNVQGDEPFVAADAIAGALEMVTSGRFSLGTAAAPADDDVLDTPDVVKVVRGDDGRALYFSRAPIPYLRDHEDRALRSGWIAQHLGVYAYRREALERWVALPPHSLERIERLEQLRPLAAGITMGVAMTSATAVPGIDTEEDLRRANERWDTLNEGRM